MLYQIGMAQPDYALPVTCNTGTTHTIGTYVGNRLPRVVSLKIFL